MPIMNIVHITPHVGGGVGSLLKAFFACSQLHGLNNQLFCLDFCTSNFNEILSLSYKREGFYYSNNNIDLLEAIEKCDVALIHYWNHPLMAKFLASSIIPPKKTIFWIHNSGLFEPHIIPYYLFNISRKVLFSSACSYEAPNLQELIRKTPKIFRAVHSTRSLDDFFKIAVNRKARNRIKSLLYVGTVSEAKMHPDSAALFAQLSKLGFEIRVVGGPDQEILKKKVVRLGANIEVFGEVKNVIPFFRDADIFIYPLRPDHYGTGEQVILEAMAAGLPVIAFDNPAERAILEKGGGLLASDAQDFVKGILRLASDSSGYLENISAVGINRIQTEFSIEQMTNNLMNITLNIADPSPFDIVDNRSFLYSRIAVNELALYALHSFFDGEEMVSNAKDCLSSLEDLVFEKISSSLTVSESAGKWCGLTKSTPFHYQQYFQDNVNLNSLCQRIAAKCGLGPGK